MKNFLLSFAIIAACIPATLAHAAPPTIAEIRAAYDAGLLSSPQADILLNATRLLAARPRATFEDIVHELTQLMEYSSKEMTAELYAVATAAMQPRPPVTASPIFPDSARRIADYYRTIGNYAAVLPADVRMEEAILRLIYVPATRDFFTPAQREALELMILSRDPATLRQPTAGDVARFAHDQYGIDITSYMMLFNLRQGIARAYSIPMIVAEQAAMRAAIEASPIPRTDAERAFAVGVLATLRNGESPSVETMGKEYGISKNRGYAIIRPLTPDTRANMIPIINDPAYARFFSPRIQAAATSAVLPDGSIRMTPEIYKALYRATEEWRLAQTKLVTDPAPYLNFFNAATQPRALITTPAIPAVLPTLPRTALPTIPPPIPGR